MKNFLSLFATAFLLSGVLFLTSCGEEDSVDPGTGTDTNPTVVISGVSATTVDGGTTVTFTVTASKGTNDMQSLTVTEDGTTMTTRYSIQEYTDNGITLNNPQLLTGNDVSNFVYTVNITVPVENVDPTLSADYVYDVTVADNKGLTDADFVTITVNPTAIPTTPLTNSLDGILLNQAGPAGTGGLILSTGASVGSAAGDIRDMGIDTDQPNASNWRRQIAPVSANGATMFVVNEAALPEGFTFANVSTVEEVLAAYDTSTTLPAEVNGIPCTNAVSVGDMFVVVKDNVYYLISIKEVNTTSTNNADNYVIDIKY